MTLFTSPGRKRAVIAALMLVAAASLAGCGSDGDDNGAPGAPAPTPAPTPAPAVDAFFAAVVAVIGVASPEDAEPNAAVESVVATLPENTEPESVS
ncbi:MAG: hypothetical protein V4693_18450 [Pseudomonadota bacterium]